MQRAIPGPRALLRLRIGRLRAITASVDLATILLNAGARLDLRDKILLSTPLGWACRWGRIEIVKLLLARGADPVEADEEPWATPRAWAEKMQRWEILGLLDKAGTQRK